MMRNADATDTYAWRWLPYVFYAFVLLYFTKDILVPISFALLISFVLYPACAWLERKGMNRMTAIMAAITILGLLGLLLIGLLMHQLSGFADEWPQIQNKWDKSVAQLSQTLTRAYGISPEQQRKWLAQLSSESGAGLLRLLRQAVSVSAVSLVLLVLVPVYVVLILLYRRHWMKVLSRLFPSQRHDKLEEMVRLTIKTYYNFIKGMAVVYLMVGLLNSLGLLALGVPHAIFFGFTASILTFIPYVGIMAGSLLPIAMAWISHDSIWYPLGVIGVFTFVQYLEANVIFPFAVSSRLNVNTLVMLLAIFVGGLLWGVAGLILFVPFLGILKLIADHNPQLKTWAMILGKPSA